MMYHLKKKKKKKKTAYINFPMALKTGKEAQKLKLSISLDCTGKSHFKKEQCVN